MEQIYDRLYLGTDYDCFKGNGDWTVVHACKSPCHQRAVNYRGCLPNSHPNYLILEIKNNLYLNIIDPPQPLFKPQLFISFLDFSRRHWNSGNNILIHCNRGESRSPSLALMFLAKHISIISNDSYDQAKEGFKIVFPAYAPGQGIQIYLRKHWGEF